MGFVLGGGDLRPGARAGGWRRRVIGRLLGRRRCRNVRVVGGGHGAVRRWRERGSAGISLFRERHAPFYVCDGRKGAARFRGVRRREPRGGDSGRAGQGCGVGARVSRTARGIRACVDARGRSERPQPRPIGVPERWVSSENVAGVVTHVVNPKRGKRTFFALFAYEGSVKRCDVRFFRSVDLIRFAVLHSRSTQISQISPTQLADVWAVWEAG